MTVVPNPEIVVDSAPLTREQRLEELLREAELKIKTLTDNFTKANDAANAFLDIVKNPLLIEGLECLRNIKGQTVEQANVLIEQIKSDLANFGG